MCNGLYSRFSAQVLNCFKTGDIAIVREFMGGLLIVNKARADRSRYSWPDGKNSNDEWSLYLHSWFWGLYPRVGLIRGIENFDIKLTSHEHRALAMCFRAAVAEKKALAKQKKQQYKIAQENAYWQDGLPQLENANG
jgi:hypothetical protein